MTLYNFMIAIHAYWKRTGKWIDVEHYIGHTNCSGRQNQAYYLRREWKI